jgi:hypothetical protein
VNPYGLIILALGIIIVIIGIKGTQHDVLAAFKKPSAAAT